MSINLYYLPQNVTNLKVSDIYIYLVQSKCKFLKTALKCFYDSTFTYFNCSKLYELSQSNIPTICFCCQYDKFVKNYPNTSISAIFWNGQFFIISKFQVNLTFKI